MSALAGHYHWPHDFWRSMGRNEFYQWVDQLWREKSKETEHGDSWKASEHDPRWQALREKREKRRGR